MTKDRTGKRFFKQTDPLSCVFFFIFTVLSSDTSIEESSAIVKRIIVNFFMDFDYLLLPHPEKVSEKNVRL